MLPLCLLCCPGNGILHVRVKISPDRTPSKTSDNRRSRLKMFRYTNAKAMRYNISFTARPGETTAIIGSTGSGRTTGNLFIGFRRNGRK